MQTARGQAAFVVPPDTPGLVGNKKLRKLGLRASHTADVFLDDVRVPGRCLLGGKERLDERLARAREGRRSSGSASMRMLLAVAFPGRQWRGAGWVVRWSQLTVISALEASDRPTFRRE